MPSSSRRRRFETSFVRRLYTNAPAKRQRITRWEGGEEPPPTFVRSRPSRVIQHRTAYRRASRIPSRMLWGIVAVLLLLIAGKPLYQWIVSGLDHPESALPLTSSSRLPDFAIPQLELSDDARVVHKVRAGESWKGVMQRYGFESESGESVRKAIADLEKRSEISGGLKSGRAVTFILARKHGIKEITFPVEGTKQVVLRRGKGQEFDGRVTRIEREQIDRVAVGVIRSSFAAAAQQAGVSYQVVDDLVDLFSDRIVFHQDFRAGDRFTVIYRDTVDVMSKPGSGIGPILAAELEVGGERLVAARYVGSDGKGRYFDEKGQLLGNSFLRYPVQFSRISSTFSFSRFHPVLGRHRPHHGVDFAAPTGTPVRSVANGKVVFSGRRGGSGNMVRVRHNEKFTTEYLHLSKISAGLRSGSAVERGQVIGAVGSTGLATGPHLHFGFFEDGKYVDPLKIKLPYLDDLTRGTRIDHGYLKRVLFTLEHYQRLDLGNLMSE